MTDRYQVEALIKQAYAARRRGDIDAICDCFAENPTFVMAGASSASPIAVQCTEGNTFRILLAGLIHSFEWIDQQILSMIVDGPRAAVHWRGRMRSTASGDEVVTELVDVVTIDDGKIQSFIEFCDTALATIMMGGDVTWREQVTV
jgi:ketosteroid isomerase-like protein